MTRTEALEEVRRRLAEAKENDWAWTAIDPELQRAANGVATGWSTACNVSIPVIEEWVGEIERGIAAEVARKLK